MVLLEIQVFTVVARALVQDVSIVTTDYHVLNSVTFCSDEQH